MLVGVGEYAKHRGVSRRAVYDAIRAGAIVQDGGKVDVAAADAAWAANVAPEPAQLKRSRAAPAPERNAAPGDAAADGGESLNAATTRKAIAAASLAELHLAQRRGELVAVADVQREWFSLGRAMRDRLLGLPDRISADLATLADQHEVRVYLDRELRGALAELTDPDPVAP